MSNLVFVLFCVPFILLAVVGLLLWHLMENTYLKAIGKPVIATRQAKVARFCDRLKAWVIEHE